MQDRIQINGTWYIREDQSVNTEMTKPVIREISDDEITQTYSITYEKDDWCFEAHMLVMDDDYTLNNIKVDWMDITDKRDDAHIEDSTDNPSWMIGVLEGSSESMEDANEIFDETGLMEFRSFVNYLIENGFLNK